MVIPFDLNELPLDELDEDFQEPDDANELGLNDVLLENGNGNVFHAIFG
jgi:hypothetical protein